MKKRKYVLLGLSLITAASLLFIYGCPPPKTEPVRPVKIADGEIDPGEWGKAYPIHYEMWKKAAEPTPAGRSKYKKGWDTDKIIYDKLSEFPYMALLFNGMGFGIEYNEPRSHYYMLKDVIEIDSSRPKPGGVCLTCKSPYAPKLEKELGAEYYRSSFKDALTKIPEKHRELGAACIDCHDNKDLSLRIWKDFTLGKALKDIGVDVTKVTRQDMRSLVCAQCHVTYIVQRDKDMKSLAVFFPWQGSTWGNIPVENIIKKLRSDPSYGEWKQAVTGFKFPFIRHPEFELYSTNSVHWKAGASCADCHMPYTKVGSFKVSDHRVMSPLKNDLKACMQCHTESTDWLKNQVTTIQDRTVSLILRAGYATATVAKIFENTHKAQEMGKKIDKAAYDKAKDYYEEALLRIIYIGAENSVGFHNPTEASRNLADAIAFAGKSEALLRQALAKEGVDVPLKVNLELNKYLENRGEKKLKFNAKQEFKDPFNIQERF